MIINKDKFLKHQEKISRTDLLKLSNELITDPPYYFTQGVFDNNLYGIGRSLLKYANMMSSHQINAYIEHGLFLGDYLQYDQPNWYVKKMITMSERRRTYIEKTIPDKEVHSIGPYIHYAESLLSLSEIKLIKKKLKRTVVFFPAHSTNIVSQTTFLNEDIAFDEYESKIVSLYYLDAQNQTVVDNYKRMGFEVFCAGPRYNWLFLSRLKSLFEIADLVCTSSIGTHVGFSLYMGTPVRFLTNFETKMAGLNNRGNDYIQNKINGRANMVDQVQEIKTALLGSGKTSNTISSKLYDTANSYWGFDQIRTVNEIKNILS
jgi:hypothetical protein